MHGAGIPRRFLVKGAALAVGAGTILGVAALCVLALVSVGFGSLLVSGGPGNRLVAAVFFAPVVWLVAFIILVAMYWWAFGLVVAAETVVAYWLSRGDVDRVSRIGLRLGALGVFLLGVVFGTLWRGEILGLFTG